MLNRFRKSKEGFTLIELMIVVAIIGVLAVLAIVGVRKYIASSKTAEARTMLGQISKLTEQTYNGETMAGAVLPQGNSGDVSRKLCQSASASVPSTPDPIKGKKYQSKVTDWDTDKAGNSGFACLKFVIDKPQYYMYNYAASSPGNVQGNSYTGTANGDLNGDGVLSTFTITGAIQQGNVLNTAPQIVEISPEE